MESDKMIMLMLPIIIALGFFLISIGRTMKIKRKAVYEIEAMVRANKQKFKKELKLVGMGKPEELDILLQKHGYDKRTRKLVMRALVNIYRVDHGMK